MHVVTRAAPSPTGFLHIGTARLALFNYLFATHHQGTFILRIDDTDKARNKKEYEDEILSSLSWLGIEYDTFFKQSDRTDIYAKYIDQLLTTEKAYVSREPSKLESGKEVEVIRFRNPNKEVAFFDLIRGEIRVDTTDLGDFVIARDHANPLLILAGIVDDYEMGVTHAIRGEDLISITPRQILVQEALEITGPQYAHLPLILAPDRSKLSKRKGTAKPFSYYQEMGILPHAMTNYLALIGWNPATNEELFTKEELIERFSLDQVQKHGAIFDETKLKWFNKEHLKKLSDEEFGERAKPFFSDSAFTKSPLFEKLVPELRERIDVFSDIKDMEASGEFAYYTEAPRYERDALMWKKDPDSLHTKVRLAHALTLLEPLTEWSKETVKNALWPYAEKEGRGEVLWPLRYALSGREKSPDPFVLAGILGKDETLSRVRFALEKLA